MRALKNSDLKKDELVKREHGAVDMTQGKPIRLILAFAIPLLLGNILQQFYNMVDSFVVGRWVGKDALAAVSTGFPLIFLMASLFIGLGMGATVIIAQYIGAGDRESVRKTINTIYSALLVIVLPLTGLGLLITVPLLRLIQVPADVFPMAQTYCLTVFAGIIGGLGYNINTGIMEGLGDSKTPLIFLAISSVMNIILDLLFVLVFHWGVFGVAFATIIAQACSWIFGIFYINHKYDFIHISFFKFNIDRDLLKKVIRLGVPSGVQQCQFSVAILLMQALINGQGTVFMAGFAAANKIDSFAFMPIQSFAAAITTYVGQNLGAGRMDRVQQGVRSTLVLSTLSCIAITAIVLPFRGPLLGIFNQEPAVIQAGEAYLLRVLGPMFIVAIQFVLNGVLRGAGAAMVPMISSIIALWLARIPAAYFFAAQFGADNIYWSYLVGWLCGITITGVVYLRGRWKDKCIFR